MSLVDSADHVVKDASKIAVLLNEMGGKPTAGLEIVDVCGHLASTTFSMTL